MTDPIEQYKDRLRKAMARMTALRDALDAERRRHRAPIAIVGIGCRLPPAIDDPETFFEALLAGHDASAAAPADRGGDVDGLPPGGYLDDVRGFDAGFFGLSPREAAAMDPQQRLLLEVTCDALERAGLPPDALPADRVGVWLGLAAGGYLARVLDARPDIYAITGNGAAFASGRLAYTLGLRGPALALDTACSSSLVAVHLAVQSLRRGETDVAIVGGVNVVTEAQSTRLLLDSGALSPTGRCRPFDVGADGFTRGEGAIAIVLRRLDDAQAAGDPVLAVIRGSAVNQDGRSTGLTAPNVGAQRTMLAAALKDAAVEPASVGYVETHGTGTALGDPIEFEALAAVLGDGEAPCLLGAVKGNVGHLEAAAGLAGLVKAVGALRRGVVPPNPTYAEPNPHLRLAGTRFVIPTAPTALPPGARVGVSAFGMSGTNAHVVLEAAPDAIDGTAKAIDAMPDAIDGTLLTLSARDPAALAALAAATADALDDGVDRRTAARTLATRRAHHPYRLATVGGAETLRAFAAGAQPSDVHLGDGEDRGAPVFVCAGQGTLWPGIGRLLDRLPAARAVIEAATPIVAKHGGFDLAALLRDADAEALHRTAHAQPATLAVTVALAAWLDAHGVRPAAVIGHSVGEISAAHLAGALDLDTALRLACARGRAMAGARAGGLLAVALDPPAAEAALEVAGVTAWLAAHNGPRAAVIGGDGDALDALAAHLKGAGTRCRRLAVPHAFHTPHMEPTLPAFERGVGSISTAPLARPLYSTVTGGRVEALGLDHWRAGIRRPVRFADAVGAAVGAGHRLFVEVGPHPALAAAIEAQGARAVATCARDAAPADLLGALGALWAARCPIDLPTLFAPGPVAPVPTYRWQRRPYWIDDARAPAAPVEPAIEVTEDTPALDRVAIGRRVRAEVAAVLGLGPDDPLPERRGLFDLGFDSMMSVELARRLSRALDRPLSPTAVFDHPTVAGLVDHLAAAAVTAPDDRREARAGAPIAIVGMACRLPGGANDPDTLWDHLDAGRIAIGPVPPDRWDAAAYHDPDPAAAGKMYATHSGFLAGVDLRAFDAAAFGISPAEARALDPQQRLLLELTYEALEDAGHPADRLEGSRTGVYVGIATSDYGQHVARRPLADYEPSFATGCANNTAAGRIAYTLGTRGPAMAIDTACSSSLVGLHLAVEALRRGEIDRAIVAGTNLIIDPTIGVLYSRLGALAPDNRCKAFDAGADGLVRGEGVAVVVLGRLDDARRAGDRIYAAVLGAAVNHDGRSSGLTVPSGPAQAAVVRDALRDAGVEGGAVEYVETHGTGTSLGDPIEANALVAALGHDRAGPLVLGSVKANLGHLEPAAGLAGLIKVVGALRRRVVPPQPTFTRLNPAIEPGGVELVVPTAPTPIAGRLAGLSSFGVSGTNAHVILAGPNDIPDAIDAMPDAIDGPHLLPISARDADRRVEQARAWRARLADDPTPVALLCAGAALRRAHHGARLAVTGDDRAGLIAALDGWLADGEGTVGDARDRRVALVFSGQGGFWLGMGRGLWQRDAVFTRAFAAAAAASDRHGGPALVDALVGELALDDKRVLHPLMLGLQAALAVWLRHHGVEPAAVVGHSSGELAAAVVAGALGLDDAFRVSVARSAAIDRVIGHGAMAVVGLGPEAVGDVLVEGADIAVHNAPGEVIVSGDGAAIDAIEVRCAAGNVFFRRVKGADGAGHSHHFDPHLDAFRAAIEGIEPRATRVSLYSTVTAAPIDGAALDADYWVANLRRRVRFAEAIEALVADGIDTFVEVGPHPVLLRPIARVAPSAATVETLRRDTDDRRALLGALGALYVIGVEPDWARLHPGGCPAIELPRQPWRRETFWMPPGRDDDRGRHPLVGRDFEVARTGERVVEGIIDRDRRDLPAPVTVQGVAVLDPALIVAFVAAAAPGPMAVTLGEARPFEQAVELQASLTGPAFELHARVDGGGWHRLGGGAAVEAASDAPGLASARAACATPDDGHAERMAGRGLVPSPTLDVIEQVWRGPSQAIARLTPTGATWAATAAVSSGLGLLAAQVFAADAVPVAGELFWPTAIELVELPRVAGWAHATLRGPVHPTAGTVGDVWFYDAAGRPVGALGGVRLAPMSRSLARAAVRAQLDRWCYATAWAPKPASGAIEPGVWLVLGDGAALATALDARGHRAIVRDDLTVGLREARAAGPLRGVVEWATDDGDATTRAQRAIATSRALIDARAPRWVRISRGAQPVGAGEGPDPHAAIGWTIARTAALEHPDLAVRLIDLDPTDPMPMQTAAAELVTADGEDLVGWRAGVRYVQRLTPEAPPWPAAPLRFDADATYLVTGGLGGVGAQLAAWLVERGARHVVLTSRSGPTSDDRRATLAALRAAGATVEAPAVDVTDAVAMAALIAGFERPLRGVFHAAGATGFAPLVEIEPSAVAPLIAAKVDGALLLDRLTADAPLDHFVCFSSASATWGAAGLSLYAAANHALDLLAHRRRAAGRPGLTVAWGGWAGGGMTDEATRAGAAEMGLLSSPAPHLLEALDAAMQADAPHCTIAEVDWRRFKPLLEARGPRPLLAAIEVQQRVGGDGPLAKRLDALPAGERWSALLDAVGARAAQALGLDGGRLDLDAGFFQLGMDSVMTVNLRRALELDLGGDLPPTLILDQPTARALATWLGAERLAIAPAAEAPPPAPEPPPEPDDLDALSEDDLEALLLAELGGADE